MNSMKNAFLTIVLSGIFFMTSNIFAEGYKSLASEIDTLYYLPDTAAFVTSYLIVDEIYGIHMRFDPKGSWSAYRLKEIQYLFTTTSVGDTLKKIDFYKDTLTNLVYSQNINVVLTENDVYPNWYKVTIPGSSPVIFGTIEVPVYVTELNSICKTDPAYLSGRTIGFHESGQQWGIVDDRPIRLIIEEATTDIKDEKILPLSNNLEQNYPNPFNPSTTISFNIEEGGLVQLQIYDVLGNEIATLVNEVKQPGNYLINFNAGNLPSGLYLYKLINGNYTGARKMILIK